MSNIFLQYQAKNISSHEETTSLLEILKVYNHHTIAKKKWYTAILLLFLKKLNL